MRFSFRLFAVLFLFPLCWACEPTATGEAPEDTPLPVREEQPVLPESHNCEPRGEVLEDNQFWLRAEQTLLTIEADSTTYDANFGESHRILRVYDTRNCEVIFSRTLPVDDSPDFPYYLAAINYNRSSLLVAIRGARHIYCYDVAEKKLLPKLTPSFRQQTEASDAQSGRIQHLELYEDYLIGYAADYGFFGFDLRQKRNVAPLLPSAEFEFAAGRNALFFVASEEDLNQALVTTYDNEANFKLNPLFAKPTQLNTQINDRVRNNRFIIISQNGTSGSVPVAIDMQKAIRVKLPAEVADQPVQAILQWLRTNS